MILPSTNTPFNWSFTLHIWTSLSEYLICVMRAIWFAYVIVTDLVVIKLFSG